MTWVAEVPRDEAPQYRGTFRPSTRFEALRQQNWTPRDISRHVRVNWRRPITQTFFYFSLTLNDLP